MLNPTSERELFTRRFESVEPDRLWSAVKRVVSTMDCRRVDDDEMSAVFATGMSTWSWGQNLVAEVFQVQPGGATLVVRGRPKSSFLTTSFGERRHARGVERQMVEDIEGALADR